MVRKTKKGKRSGGNIAIFDGFATKAQTISKLKMAMPNLQICFRTEAALRTLKFVGGEMV